MMNLYSTTIFKTFINYYMLQMKNDSDEDIANVPPTFQVIDPRQNDSDASESEWALAVSI